VSPHDTADIDALLWHYARPLPPDQRDEFYRAARDALSGLRVLGAGSVHRAIVKILHDFFVPLPDTVSREGIRPHHRRSSKLAALPPVA
jgi:hypothetical protein